MLTFHIEFEFRSKLLQSLMGVLFKGSDTMAAFAVRARQLYSARQSGATRRAA